ncbi:hypothetical protein [Fimbriimonas ginsengisoli]|uniref:Uncharacterized protein n=1 Tax=Fimbriimonas ginsengisoli Gsoil 348 TaxID=661478 RepID=A0A068NUY0_FIMGI|nr:hypothetical protein [Fimbriimonas ginsengisoli]AIE85409.1 hypothetical protein OP10G_2041 [Fimbriimonas ginsengisoli Gsoil 348]
MERNLDLFGPGRAPARLKFLLQEDRVYVRVLLEEGNRFVFITPKIEWQTIPEPPFEKWNMESAGLEMRGTGAFFSASLQGEPLGWASCGPLGEVLRAFHEARVTWRRDQGLDQL